MRRIGATVDGSNLYPSSDTILPRNKTSRLNMVHFFGFSLTPCALGVEALSEDVQCVRQKIY